MDKTVLALQQAALAQVEATLPPLRKALSNKTVTNCRPSPERTPSKEPLETFRLDPAASPG